MHHERQAWTTAHVEVNYILTEYNCFFHKSALKNEATTFLPQLITWKKKTK